MSTPRPVTFGTLRMTVNEHKVTPFDDEPLPFIGTVRVTVGKTDLLIVDQGVGIMQEGIVLVQTPDRVRKHQQACAILSTGEVGGWRRRDRDNPDRPAIKAWWAETARAGEVAMLSKGRKARPSELP